MEFQKTAKEAHMLNQRLTGLYEDIGHVLNRYYEIDEVMSEDKGDMDNDGKDEPDDEEYMDNKDKAIKSAMKNERLGDPDGRDMVSRPDGADRDARDSENESLDPDNSDQVDQPDDPAKDGEEMKEGASRQSVESDPDKQAGDNPEVPDGEGREVKEGSVRLKDIVNSIVGMESVGTSISKK